VDKKELDETVRFSEQNEVSIKIIDRGGNHFGIEIQCENYTFCLVKQKRKGVASERIFRTLDAVYGISKKIRNSGISIHLKTTNTDNPFNL
jgi:hypothetical protein